MPRDEREREPRDEREREPRDITVRPFQFVNSSRRGRRGVIC